VEQRASTPPPPEPIEPPCSAPPALTDAERLELEAQAAKIRKQNALIRNASKDTYNKRKLLSELNQQFNQLANGNLRLECHIFRRDRCMS
jgi:hypothetical protein